MSLLLVDTASFAHRCIQKTVIYCAFAYAYYSANNSATAL